jgi:crotonobetainyl-CoA:carnitine CoA-transferase CaiB-like acyl-CoA transferase
MAVQVQDLVWLPGETDGPARAAVRADLHARADEIAGGVAMNPYYRCFETSDGFIAVACLNLTQRRALLDLFGLDDETVAAPDLVPDDPEALARKEQVTAEIAAGIATETVATWLERLAAVGVPAGPVLARETVADDAQVRAAGLVGQAEQHGLGTVTMLGPLLDTGADSPSNRLLQGAPAIGEHTEEVLSAL